MISILFLENSRVLAISVPVGKLFGQVVPHEYFIARDSPSTCTGRTKSEMADLTIRQNTQLQRQLRLLSTFVFVHRGLK